MVTVKKKQRQSFLCPNCRKLVSRSESECPSCGLKNPGSIWNNNIFTRGTGENDAILKVIFATNITMFVLSLVVDLKHTGFSSSPFNFLSPSNKSLFILGSTGSIPIFQLNRWWSLLSANYLHGSLLHLVFNMIAIYQIGPLLIREYGSSRMTIIYTLSGIGGFLISSVFGVQFTIGASAAVCGLIGAALYYGKSRGGAYGDAIYSQIGGWAIGIFLFGFLVPGINNWGHAGGMLVGALLGYFLGYRERSREKIGHKLSSLSCVVFTGIILFWSLINGILYLAV
jgi:rhomboid protease GluP